MDKLSVGLVYKGCFATLPSSGNCGDVVMCNDKTYVYIGSTWDMVGTLDTIREPELPHPTNCKNCGAVLHSSKCEFCGTEY